MDSSFKKRKGFTLVELIIVVAVISIISFGAILSSYIMRAQREFQSSYQQVEDIFQEARGLSLSGQAYPDFADYDNDGLFYEPDGDVILPNGYIVDISAQSTSTASLFFKNAFAQSPATYNKITLSLWADLFGSNLDEIDVDDVLIREAEIIEDVLFDFTVVNSYGETVSKLSSNNVSLIYKTPNAEMEVLNYDPGTSVEFKLYTEEGREKYLFFHHITGIPELGNTWRVEEIAFEEEAPPEVEDVLPPPPEPACGNGIVEIGEECDDGNTVDGDGCSANCTTEPPPYVPECGNGILDIEEGEECDDGNRISGDGCTSNCLIEQEEQKSFCGDGIVDITRGEFCDDGNNISGDGCSADCMTETTFSPNCGNKILDKGEECDDGNLESGDGCSPFCTIETKLR